MPSGVGTGQRLYQSSWMGEAVMKAPWRQGAARHGVMGMAFLSPPPQGDGVDGAFRYDIFAILPMSGGHAVRSALPNSRCILGKEQGDLEVDRAAMAGPMAVSRIRPTMAANTGCSTSTVEAAVSLSFTLGMWNRASRGRMMLR